MVVKEGLLQYKRKPPISCAIQIRHQIYYLGNYNMRGLKGRSVKHKKKMFNKMCKNQMQSFFKELASSSEKHASFAISSSHF